MFPLLSPAELPVFMYIPPDEPKDVVPVEKVRCPLTPDIPAFVSLVKNTNAPDGILALYHDQGLIPVKIITLNYSVNTTIGLPIVRTSPDHGTGFDIAWKGIAQCQSMIEAIKTANDLLIN